MNTSAIRYLVNTLDPKGIPVVTPAGVLGGHLDAMKFCEHIPQEEYPAGALAAALYLCSGVRGMERGTVASVRDENGKEILADGELVRLASPRRVFTLSQIKYVIDRLEWLYENRHLIGGLRFTYEPPVLRFFMGGLEPTTDWPARLMEKFRKDFGDSLKEKTPLPIYKSLQHCIRARFKHLFYTSGKSLRPHRLRTPYQKGRRVLQRPLNKTVQIRQQIAPGIGQTILDTGRHFGIDLSVDQPVRFERTQGDGQHPLRNIPERTLNVVETHRPVRIQRRQHQQRPLVTEAAQDIPIRANSLV